MTESGSGQPLEEIIPGANAKYYWTGSSWETDYLHGNHLGSTQLVTRADSSNSYAQAENMYAFGRVRWSGGGTQDIRYAGMQERDAETLGWQDSLDWTPNRLFSENMGRWLSPDPLAGDITNPQSLNRYSYVMNNPLNSTDPSGLGPIEPWGPGCVAFFNDTTESSDGGTIVQTHQLAFILCNGTPGDASGVSGTEGGS